ncbi:lung adenoma susceptibility protein 2 [Mixophyes fleayi]|uniref:lung adenoma susceptibility protein 2 n=1 Tax=Mixophyes fleayi TaxID=3061075 RepID=UPI003F4E1076
MDRPSSPDSSISISSLLASCSLSKSSVSTKSVGSIEYKDRLYDSASKALEAYIEDHEESLNSPIASTGKITIRQSAHLSSAKRRGMKYSKGRHKHPSPRRRCAARDPDLLSLTTDDLLCFPSDGSRSFSQASEERKTVKKHYGSSLKNRTTLSSPLTASNGRTTFRSLGLEDHSLHSLDLQCCRVPEPFIKERRKMAHVLAESDRENNPTLYNNPNSPYMLNGSTFCKSYPRWLTSQKSELGVSGITSIPDVKYPLWLRDHGLLNGSESQSTSIQFRSPEDGSVPQTYKYLYGSSSLDWPDCLHAPIYDLSRGEQGYKMVNSSSCMDGKKHSQPSDLDIIKHLHTPQRNDPSDLPVQRLEPEIDISKKEFTQLPHDNGSPRTEEVLEGERSWENIPCSFKSPVPVLDEETKGPLKLSVIEDFLNDCVKQESNAATFSGGNHHGPVEALKHMLFNMQAFQQNLNQDGTSENTEQCQKISAGAKSEIQLVDQETFPVNKSLQKALHHLSRLKELVGDQNMKPNQENNQEIEV